MKRVAIYLLSIVMLLNVTGCKKKNAVENPEEIVTETYKNDPITAAAKMVEGMRTREKIYQLFITTPEMLLGGEQRKEAGDTAAEVLANSPVGGILYCGGNIENKEQLTKLLQTMDENTKIPLFQMIDEEDGTEVLAAMDGMGVSAVPSRKEIGEGKDPQRAFDTAKTLATEIKALGFNVHLAPVADMPSERDEVGIGDRAFGTDAALVSTMVGQAVLGSHEGGVATVVKHFPGYGSSIVNAKNGRAESNRTYEEMQMHELLPLKAGIDAATDFVMVSHMIHASLTKTNMECSMSTNVMKTILRDTMGFPNIIMTDSLSKDAITAYYSAGAAAVTALEAGADMLFLPADLDAAYAAIDGAMKSGRITEERLNQSVARILKVKLMRGIL